MNEKTLSPEANVYTTFPEIIDTLPEGTTAEQSRRSLRVIYDAFETVAASRKESSRKELSQPEP